jgi:hypothetical protein
MVKKTGNRDKIDRAKMSAGLEKGFRNFLDEKTEEELERLEEYNTAIENKFIQDKTVLSKSYDKKFVNKKLPSEIEYMLGEQLTSEYYIIDNLFLKTFRYSMIVTIYSLIEMELNYLCRYLCHTKQLVLTLDEVRGDGIERAKVYLSKVCDVNFPDTNEWNEITKLNKIRNCIVHAQGDTDGANSPAKIKNIVKNTSSISLESDRFIRIETIYINTILTKTKKFFKDIYKKSFEKLG